jgi:hypothetical protein
MPLDHEHQQHPDQHRSRGNWVLIGFLAIGAFFLLTEHRAHLFGILPFLLLLACPLMHLFHGHGGHGGHVDSDRPPNEAPVAGSPPAAHQHGEGENKS